MERSLKNWPPLVIVIIWICTFIFIKTTVYAQSEIKLIASDGAENDYFGWSVSISGDRAIIGALWNDDAGSNSGSAYIFSFDGTSWSEEAKLTASDAAANDEFGCSVSISGDRAIIGAKRNSDAGSNSGSAYIFSFDGTSWNEEVKITASDAERYDWFGNSVSIDGNRVIVGARNKDNALNSSGSAYIFSNDGTNWSEEAKLIASDAASRDYFGCSVSIKGNRVIIGAEENDDAGGSSGSAYIFSFNGTSW
ncbi:FG-GAP repeat protein, partial [Bacteroidota bacterium]